MTTRLIIARHGNTFAPGDTPTRVGRRTDLPLVASGEAQARRIGDYLRRHQMVPDAVFTAPLKRSYDTARLAVEALGRNLPITIDARFSEIDYGPDEKPARISRRRQNRRSGPAGLERPRQGAAGLAG